MPEGLVTQEDKKIKSIMMNYFINFSANGQPGLQQNIDWKPVESQNFQTMKIDSKLQFGVYEKMDKIQFWLENICPEQKQSAWNDEPIPTLYQKIAEKRYSKSCC